MKIFRNVILISCIFIFGFAFGAVLVVKNQQNYIGIHYSTKNPQIVNSALARIGEISKISNVSVVVVNHHLLASDLIAGTLGQVASEDPITIILVSPNHFTRGKGQVISSRFDWSTPFGNLSADQKTIDFLTTDNIVNVDESPFVEEHGIYNIIPFVKKFFPKSKVVPLLLKYNLQDGQIDLLAKKIALVPDSLVIFSFDFSHYQTKKIADEHDRETTEAINNYDFVAIKNLDVDSKPGIRLMLKFSLVKNTTKFEVLYHSNSFNYTNIDAQTTSYIDGVFVRTK